MYYSTIERERERERGGDVYVICRWVTQATALRMSQKEKKRKRRVGARATCVVPTEEKTGVVVHISGVTVVVVGEKREKGME